MLPYRILFGGKVWARLTSRNSFLCFLSFPDYGVGPQLPCLSKVIARSELPKHVISSTTKLPVPSHALVCSFPFFLARRGVYILEYSIAYKTPGHAFETTLFYIT
jgi:hypothetical protein